MAEHKNFQPTNPDSYQKYPNYFKPFRFFCQHVLPLVYDDSLSYYELLCKVVQKLNEVTNSVNMLIDDYKALEEAFEELIKYVDDYFNELVDEMNDLKEQWAEFKAEIEKEMADFKAQIEAAQEAFEEKITTQQNNFEAKITEEQENFENEITTQQNNFETKITEQQDNFEDKITTQQNNFETKLENEQTTYETNLTNEWNTYKTNLNSEWTTYQTNLNTQFQNMLDKAQEAIDSLNDAVEALPDTVKTEVEEQLAEKLPEVKSELEEYCLSYLKTIPAVKYYPSNAEAIADVANLSEGEIIVVGRQSTSSYLANGGVYRIKTHENSDPVLNTTDTYEIKYNTVFALSDELTAVNIRFNYNFGHYSEATANAYPYKENFGIQTLSNDNVSELYAQVDRNYRSGNRFPTPIEIIMYDLNTIDVMPDITNPFPDDNSGVAYFNGVMIYGEDHGYLRGLMVVYNDADNPTDVQLYYIGLSFGVEGTGYRFLQSCIALTYVTPSTLDDKLANYTSTTDLETKLNEVKTEANTYTDNKLEDYYTNTEVDEKLTNITTTTQNVFRVDTELTAETIANAMASKWGECYNKLNSSSNFIIIFNNKEEITIPASDGYESFEADTFLFYGSNSSSLSGIAYSKKGSNYTAYPFYCGGTVITSRWISTQNVFVDDCTATTNVELGDAIYTAYTTYKEQTNGENFVIVLNCTNEITVPAGPQTADSFIANKFIITYDGAIISNDEVSGIAYRLSESNDGTERVNAFYCNITSSSTGSHIPYSCTSKGNNIIELEFDTVDDFSLQEIANKFPNKTIQKEYLVHIKFNEYSNIPGISNYYDNIIITDMILLYDDIRLSGIGYNRSYATIPTRSNNFGSVVVVGSYIVGEYSGKLFSSSKVRDYILDKLNVTLSDNITMIEAIKALYENITTSDTFAYLVKASYIYGTPIISDLSTTSERCLVTLEKISDYHYIGKIIPYGTTDNIEYHWQSFFDSSSTFADKLKIVKFTGESV